MHRRIAHALTNFDTSSCTVDPFDLVNALKHFEPHVKDATAIFCCGYLAAIHTYGIYAYCAGCLYYWCTASDGTHAPLGDLWEETQSKHTTDGLTRFKAHACINCQLVCERPCRPLKASLKWLAGTAAWSRDRERLAFRARKLLVLLMRLAGCVPCLACVQLQHPFRVGHRVAHQDVKMRAHIMIDQKI